MGHVNVDRADRKTELGYWIAEDYQGRGIVTRAVRALIDHAFAVLNLNRVEIQAAQTNVRSRAIAEKLGFRLEGTLRQSEWADSRYLDHAVYGLLRAEWKPEP